VDTETMGLDPRRDRLCLVQLSSGDGSAHLVQLIPQALGGRGFEAPNLRRLLADPAVTKLFHFARFDVAALRNALGVDVAPVLCTKIASKLVRTYTDRHGLKDSCRDLLGVELSKQQQTSDWGAPDLSPEQCAYRRQRRAAPARALGEAGSLAGARGRRAWRSPASTSCRPRRARPARLRGAGHLPALGSPRETALQFAGGPGLALSLLGWLCLARLSPG
jgi:hypothetical protein